MPDRPKGGGPSLGNFDQYADSYDAVVNKAIAMPGLSVDFFTAAKIDYINGFLSTHFDGSNGLSLLDVGCGVGNYHRFLKAGNRRISGIDVSGDSLETARQRNPDVDYRLYGGTEIPFETAQFDFAFAVCVFHHIPPVQRAAVTADVRRVVRPGGWFAVFEHNPLNPLTMRVVNRCPFDADAVLLKKQETESLLRTAGFSDVKTDFILTVPMKGKVGLRIDRLFSSLPFGSQYMTFGRC